MDKIWDGNPSKSEVIVAGMKKTNEHAEPTKLKANKFEIAVIKYMIILYIKYYIRSTWGLTAVCTPILLLVVALTIWLL